MTEIEIGKLVFYLVLGHTQLGSGLSPGSLLRGLHGVLEIKYESDVCKANALPAASSL